MGKRFEKGRRERSLKYERKYERVSNVYSSISLTDDEK